MAFLYVSLFQTRYPILQWYSEAPAYTRASDHAPGAPGGPTIAPKPSPILKLRLTPSPRPKPKTATFLSPHKPGSKDHRHFAANAVK